METAKQVSVFLENKPGRLALFLSALAKEKINVVALTVMDSHEHSALRIVTEDVAKTLDVVNAMNLRHVETEVLLVELRHQPGALANVCELLAAEHINIDYCYCSSGGKNGRVLGIFKVSNMEKAMRLLGASSNNKRMEKRLPRDRRTVKTPGGRA
ncbi:MAG: ACT domain-containing protein [Gemmataceae bacterium]